MLHVVNVTVPPIVVSIAIERTHHPGLKTLRHLRGLGFTTVPNINHWNIHPILVAV